MGIEIVKAFQKTSNEFLNAVFNFFTLFGEELFFFIVFLGIYWCFSKECAFKFGFFYVFSYFINSIIKSLIMRPRPYLVSADVQNFTTSSAYSFSSSFPSGHAQGYAFVVTFSGMQVSKTFKTSKKFNTIMWSILAVLGVLVAVSRVYLGQHYLSDVVVGLGIGVGLAILFSYILSIIPASFKDEVTLKRIILFLIPVVFILFFLIVFTSIIQSPNERVLFYKFIGSFLGASFGYIIDSEYIKYNPKSTIISGFSKFIMGLSLVVSLNIILRFFLPDIVEINVIIYYVLAVFATIVLPIMFNVLLGQQDEVLENEGDSQNESKKSQSKALTEEKNIVIISEQKLK